jgi:hypothetical protein
MPHRRRQGTNLSPEPSGLWLAKSGTANNRSERLTSLESKPNRTARAGSVFEIFELDSTHKDGVWVKAYIPHTQNTMYLKISGDELAHRFELVR